MIYLPMTISKFLVCAINLVLIFTVSSYAAKLKTNKASQVHKQTKSKIKMSEPLTGEWSGQHITIKFTSRGADVEYDCARGTIAQKIILDKNKRFSATGTYEEEHGGPVREDEQTESIAVKYSGQISGKKMTLFVKAKDSRKVIGNFTLLRGQESLLVKCR